MKEFAIKLKAALSAADMLEKDLYPLVGMTQAGFSVMKKNGSVRADVLGLIAQATGVPVSYFYDEQTTELTDSANMFSAIQILRQQLEEKDKLIKYLLSMIEVKQKA